MKRICVLGHRGMLGHVVLRYLIEAGYEVLTINDRFAEMERSREFVAQINDLAPDWCINCIGIRSGPGVSPDWVDAVNHLLPAACSQYLNPDCGLIHASSDAVFSPSAGDCAWDREMDAADVYGKSKRDAEGALRRANDIVIRCSIVGPEQSPPKSLLGWLCQQEGVVRGFSNQWWNGVTTLEWAKECECRMADAQREDRCLQLASEPVVSKGELLRMIVDQWGLSCELRIEEGPAVVRRPLVPNRKPRSIRRLLAELHAWY